MMAPLGVAEDTEGSIRVPAAMCGIVGFRPTTYRYPNGGAAPISALFDQVGPHARNVGDIILFDQVITDNYDATSPVSLKGLKLGVDRGYWFAGLDSEVARITEQAMQTFERAGVEFVETEVPDLRRLIQRITEVVQMHDVLLELPKYLLDSGASVTLDQIMAQSNLEFGIVPDEVYLAARDTYLPALRRTFRDYFTGTGVAAILFPTTMAAAPKIGVDEQSISFVTSVARNIAPGSTGGLPGLVLPSGLTKGGLPVSIEIDGPAGCDRELLGLGLSIESLLPANDFRFG
jgi:mandelamide amidase